MIIEQLIKSRWSTRREPDGYGTSRTRIADEVLEQFSGFSVKDDAQLLQLLQTLIPKGHQLIERETLEDTERKVPLREGVTWELPTFRTFEERGPKGDTDTSWSVELDFRDGPKKEQVSLTLESARLRKLRAEAKATGRSLSSIIDARLATAEKSTGDEIAKKHERILWTLENLADTARREYKELLSRPAQAKHSRRGRNETINAMLKR